MASTYHHQDEATKDKLRLEKKIVELTNEKRKIDLLAASQMEKLVQENTENEIKLQDVTSKLLQCINDLDSVDLDQYHLSDIVNICQNKTDENMTQNKEMQELVNTCKRSFKSVHYTNILVNVMLMNLMISLLRVSTCFCVGVMHSILSLTIYFFIAPRNGFSPNTVALIRASIHTVVAVCWILTLPLTRAQQTLLHPTQHPPVISWIVGSALGFTAMVVVRSSIRPIRAHFGIISFLCFLLLAYKWESLVQSREHVLPGAVVGLLGAATVGYWDDENKEFAGELLEEACLSKE